jgi:hypothetical protein
MSDQPNIPTLPKADKQKGSPRRALLGMTAMAGVVLGLNAAVTQFVAWRLHYPALCSCRHCECGVVLCGRPWQESAG